MAFLFITFSGIVFAQVPPFVLKHSVLPPAAGLSAGRLGNSLAMDGNFVVAGAPGDLSASTGSAVGAVKVFDATSGALLHVLTDPSPVSGEQFGYSVAISGTRVIVGVPYDSTGASYTGSVRVYDLSSATPTVPVLTLNNPAPGGSDNFGSAVAISGSLVVVGAALDDTSATDAGSAYVFDLSSATPNAPMATLNDPALTANDQFGYSVAISGSRVVVGARLDDTSGINSGRAYVYNMSAVIPTKPTHTLVSPAVSSGAFFGSAVTISDTMVGIGAPQANSAYIFDVSGKSPLLLHTLAPGQTSFGSSVSLEGTRLLVGAYSTNKAYVFELSSGTPTVPAQTLLNPTPEANDYFGTAVAQSADRVAIGAPYDNTGAADAGSVYLYDVTSATPTVPTLTLNHPGPALDYQFGSSVAVSGALVVVGVPQASTDLLSDYIGVVYVYDTSSATPTVPVFTLANPATQGSKFGTSVAISGSRVVVGAPLYGSVVYAEGIAYVYDLSGATPTLPVVTLNNPSPTTSDYFGASVAISGARVVVGTPYDDTGASDAGSAYVFDLTSGTPSVPVQSLNNPSPAAEDYFGLVVAISGTRIVVGAHQDDTGASNAGSAYMYDLTSGTPAVPVTTLNNPEPLNAFRFGQAVAIDGSRVLVGSRATIPGFNNAGAAYVYDMTSGAPAVPVFALSNPSPVEFDSFGSSVAISGTRLVIGTKNDDTGATDAGNAYIYDLSGGTPTVPVATLVNPAPGASDFFGSSVGIDGTTISVGVPFSNITGRDQGAAYIFAPPSANADLADLTLSAGALSPSFATGILSYTTDVPLGTSTFTVKPTTAEGSATIKVNGSTVISGNASGNIPLSVGANTITIVVTASNGVSTKTYVVTANVPASGTIAFANPVFTVNSSSVGTTADIVIQRTASIVGSITCTLSSADGSATAPTQYTSQSNTAVTLGDNVSVQHIMIPIAANATTTVAKVFTVTLGNGSLGATFGSPSTATVVILPPASATDAVKPAVTITAPANAATLVDTLPVTISGTATDNIGIAKVQVSLNGGISYTDASVTSIGSTSATYTLNVQPLPGVNNLRVRALDFKGNVSALASRTFTHLRTLTVGVSGPANSGSVSAGFVPTSTRQVGKSYSMTATPKAGFVFNGWTVNNMNGTGITAATAELPVLPFTMQLGLTLTAKFIANPFTPAVTGDYSGLILASAAQPAGGTFASNATVGLCTAKLTGTGALTGTLKIDGLSLPFTAVSDNTGVARFGKARATSLTLLRPGKPSLVLTLQAALTSGTNRITGTLVEIFRGDKTAESTIIAHRHAYSTTAPVAAQYVKSYTARLKARTSQGAGFTSQDYPQGDGYLTFKVLANGTVTMSGKLADDTAVLMSGNLSQANHWPIFQSLYGNKGCIAADAVLDDTQTNTDATAINMLWFRPFQNVQWYPYGWSEGIFIDMLASKYTPSPATVFPGLAATNPTTGNTDLKFTNGLLSTDMTKFINLTTTNVLTKAPLTDTSFTFVPAFTTGVLNGTFTHNDGSKPKWQGVLMQKGANKGGHGYFMSTKPKTVDYLGESGAMHWLAK
jgi:hypothetical protein